MSNTGKATTEKNFEEAIESWLLSHSGYTKADNKQFDAELGLDKTTLLAFIKDTWVFRPNLVTDSDSIVSDHSPPSSILSFEGVKQIQVQNSAPDFLLHQQGASNARSQHTLATPSSPQR